MDAETIDKLRQAASEAMLNYTRPCDVMDAATRLAISLATYNEQERARAEKEAEPWPSR